MERTVAAKPKLVHIATAHAKAAEGSAIVPRNQYVEIRQEKPTNKYQQDAPGAFGMPTPLSEAEGNMTQDDNRKPCVNPARSNRPVEANVLGHSLYGRFWVTAEEQGLEPLFHRLYWISRNCPISSLIFRETSSK